MYKPDWDEWWSLAESSPHSTFFHTPLWGELAEIRGYEPMPFATSHEGTDWLFPAVKRQETFEKFGLSKSINILESMFCGTYGGWVSPSGSNSPPASLYNKLTEGADIVLTTENPISKETLPSNWSTDENFTQILNLSSGYSDLKAKFSDGRTRGIESARENGVSIREADGGDDWDSYFRAYQDSLERWDDPSSIYSSEFFDRAYELSEKYPEEIRLWLAEVDEEVASGAIVFYWNNHVDYWHGASHSEYFDYNPNDLLQAEIIREACESGYSWYDFNPSGGHEGVVKFKQQFGPEKRQISNIDYKDPKVQLASSLLNKIR